MASWITFLLRPDVEASGSAQPEVATIGGLSAKRGVAMSMDGRIESLKERHASLESRIADEDGRPRPDTDTLMRLKVEKLHVKEELDRLLGAHQHA